MLADALLSSLPSELVPPPSTLRFPDGADFRIEIPSVEGPKVLAEVVKEAKHYGLTINRVSQGSGAMLHTEGELREMSKIASGNGIEVSLFIGPREEWGINAMSRSVAAAALGGSVRGMRQLRYAVEDALRAIECGIRGLLIADLGLLQVLSEARTAGRIPSEVVFKVSVMEAPSNPATLKLLESIGGDTFNLPTDLSLNELSEMRSVTKLPLDLYIEAPDNLGGVVRGNELADLVAAASPLYVKFGLRDSRPLYPSGLHLENEATNIAREKVRRASISLEWLNRDGRNFTQSQTGAEGMGIPQP
ncbi:MAG: U32 family peptidase [Actinobacteria bacterium]|nr:U32 family peptidase [Actinomycetota bacterium]